MSLHLFACAVEGKHVFLDLEQDRYFRLPDKEEAIFGAIVQGSSNAASGTVEPLLRAGVLTAGPVGKPAALTKYPTPAHSLLEMESRAGPLTWAKDLVEITLLVRAARLSVARRQLPRLIERISRNRRQSDSDPIDRRDALAQRFLAVRPFVPVQPNCLRDSLALHRFLTRRGVHADLVIGVKLYPFGAHCWLQDRMTVLNDSLHTAREFQPVLVA